MSLRLKDCVVENRAAINRQSACKHWNLAAGLRFMRNAMNRLRSVDQIDVCDVYIRHMLVCKFCVDSAGFKVAYADHATKHNIPAAASSSVY